MSAYLRDALLALQGAAPADLAMRVGAARRGARAAARGGGRRARGGGRAARPCRRSGRRRRHVRILVNQNNHWAQDEGRATDLGGGRFRHVVPAGVTDAGTTAITATADTAAFLAEGYARVEQRWRRADGAAVRLLRRAAVRRAAARTRSSRRASAPEPCASSGAASWWSTRAGRARRGRAAGAGARTGDGRTVSQRREYRRLRAGGERVIFAMRTSVVIIGAGPAGMATAIALARLDVPCLLVDRLRERSTAARATVVSTGAMERLRALGSARAGRGARARRRDEGWRGAVARAAGGGRPRHRSGCSRSEQVRVVSPARPTGLSQDQLEPLLEARLRTLPAAQVELATSFVGRMTGR